MRSCVDKFRQAIMDAGLNPPEHISPDHIHRFAGINKPRNNRAGWCWLSLDGNGGAFGCWATGFQQTWREDNKRLPKDEWLRLQKAINQQKIERQQELDRQYIEAACTAQSMWNQSVDAIFHPYLQKKCVLPFGICQRNNLLIIPLRDTEGKIWSYQTIDDLGRKMFLKGGKVSGNFYQIGEITDQVYIAEGFATAATLNQVLNIPVVVAFNAGNLKTVATAIALKYPQIKITIAADNDTETEGNPGLTKGRGAAASIGADLIYPRFDNEDFNGSDFNDYVLAGGVL